MSSQPKILRVVADSHENDPIVTVAQWMAHLAMLIYLYTIFGSMIFKSSFFRQMALIFQLIKLFLIFAGLLPCVLHSQANVILPGVTGTYGRLVVIVTLLVINIALAVCIRRNVGCCYLVTTAKRATPNENIHSGRDSRRKSQNVADTKKKRS